MKPEWRFDIAYNAALQLATAALAACGFRAERLSKHQRTIECLAYTAKLPSGDVRYLNACREKRNISVYDQIGLISLQEADEMLAFARQLRATIHKWLTREHPNLMK